jgi:SAM-dependent methyltransferase
MKKRIVPPRGSLAAAADRHLLYEESVQVPEAEVATFEKVFHRHFGRRPMRLREDFCGSGAVSCAWVRSHPERTAFGFDLDDEVLESGRARHVAALEPEERRRVELLRGDVRHPPVRRKVDVVAAGNFSCFTFHERSELIAWARSARRALGREGILVLDVLGGFETQLAPRLERRPKPGGFVYLWEQSSFDPISARARFAIHFRFRDGSELHDAFVYDWRLWSLPELRDALAEAGFRSSEVLWEGFARNGRGGDGIFRPRESAGAEAVWIAILVGIA